MAPFRGRGQGRGRGAPRGHGNDRLARSGIRTKSGYRKFDSQRVKEIHDTPSEDGAPNDLALDEDQEEESDSEESDDVEDGQPTGKSYSALLQSLQYTVGDNGRLPKRRKLEPEAIENGLHARLSNGEETDDESLNEEGQGEEYLTGEDVEEHDSKNDDLGVDDGLVGDHDVSDGMDDVDGDHPSDQYDRHFSNMDDDGFARMIKSVQANEWRTEKRLAARGWSITSLIPDCVEAGDSAHPKARKVRDLSLKQRLAQPAAQHMDDLDDVQQTIAPHMMSYADLLVGSRTPQNSSSLRQLACLHAINHVLKGRDKVLKNNARITRMPDKADELDLRDQGFTRPKVLILVETRQMCAKYASEIIDLFQPEQQENKKRFRDAFEAEVDDERDMPEDFQELFGGNNDNNFLTAIKFTRKTLKFYSAFYASDIVFASPLGLRRVIENEDVKKRDHDFLSSIEMVVVDQADAMQMQNWQNVEVVFDHLNLQLEEAHGCDFSRVRSWYLDGNAKHLRQTIVFGAYLTPEMNRLFNKSMENVAGKAKFGLEHKGAITSVSLGLKQTFSRFDSHSPAADPDDRFKYFTSAILPSLLRLPTPADGAKGVLIFIPSYYDFLRVRNFFATSSTTQNISFGAIHDYSEVSDQRRARSHFLTGRHSILLYTQRAHHFFRLKLRNVKRVVMYGLPDNPIFYEELLQGYLGTTLGEGKCSPEESSVRCAFSKWDGLRLERIVGTPRVKGMLGGIGDTFDFV